MSKKDIALGALALSNFLAGCTQTKVSSDILPIVNEPVRIIDKIDPADQPATVVLGFINHGDSVKSFSTRTVRSLFDEVSQGGLYTKGDSVLVTGIIHDPNSQTPSIELTEPLRPVEKGKWTSSVTSADTLNPDTSIKR